MTKGFRHILLLLLLTVCATVCAGSVPGDYDVLRRLSSAQLMERGRDYYARREAAGALTCFTIVSERSARDDEEARQRIRALNNCGCVYQFFYYDYMQAYSYLMRAYDGCEQERYDEFLPVVMLNMGNLLNDYITNYQSEQLARQVEDIFTKCIGKAAENRNWELMTTAFFNLSNQNYGLDLGKYAMLFSKEIPDSTPDLAYVRLQYQGLEHVQKGELEAARQCFERQLQVVSARWEPERDTVASYMSIAHVYYLEHRYEQAAGWLRHALQMATDKGMDDLAATICQRLAANCRQMGDEEKAKDYHVQYLEKREQAHASQLVSMAELNYINELKKGEAHSRQLEQQHRLQQLMLVAGGIVLLMAVVFTFLLWLKNRELTQRNRSLFEKNHQLMRVESEEQNLRKAYSKSSLNDEQRETLILRIQETLSNPEVICQQDFSLAKLAKLINSNTTYVSQVINEKYGMAFSNLLGSYRIKVACQWMDEPAKYGNLTIEAIASGTGFKSRTTFVNAFKRETGLKPSEYLRMAAAKER